MVDRQKKSQNRTLRLTQEFRLSTLNALMVLGRSSRTLVVLALTLSLGAHWAFLQSVAWMGMLVSYSQTDTLPQAIAKTFDGKHPCELCKVVQKGTMSGKKEKSNKLEKKLDSFLAAETTHVTAPPAFPPVFQSTVCGASRTEQPPIPPPRFV